MLYIEKQFLQCEVPVEPGYGIRNNRINGIREFFFRPPRFLYRIKVQSFWINIAPKNIFNCATYLLSSFRKLLRLILLDRAIAGLEFIYNIFYYCIYYCGAFDPGHSLPENPAIFHYNLLLFFSISQNPR